MNGLTERERTVFSSVGNGLTNRQVARKLGISERTVEVHVCRIIDKICPDRRSRRGRPSLALLILRGAFKNRDKRSGK